MGKIHGLDLTSSHSNQVGKNAIISKIVDFCNIYVIHDFGHVQTNLNAALQQK